MFLDTSEEICVKGNECYMLIALGMGHVNVTEVRIELFGSRLVRERSSSADK